MENAFTMRFFSKKQKTMKCMQCGVNFESESESVLCFACQMQCQKRLGSFWQRVLAFLVDNTILTFLTAILATLLGLNDPQLAEYILTQAAQNPQAISTLPELPTALVALYVFLPLVYFAGFESSRLQATPGKFLLRIYVTDLNGNAISFWRALGRYFGKIASSLILNLGYLLAAFTIKKQALHDMLAHTLVVKHPPKNQKNPR